MKNFVAAVFRQRSVVMKISVPGGFLVGAVTVVVTAWCFLGIPGLNAADETTVKKSVVSAKNAPLATKPGQLNQEQLGNLLRAMGLEPKKMESRYDFQFKAIQNTDEWDLSMTAVLSQDGSSIWIMAWLDQLPKSAADVPRTALLRLLSDNDRLGNGKFFAYVATNRRFVIQRVVANEGVTTKVFRAWLDDLGASVVETFDHWSVAAWKATETGSSATAKAAPVTNKPAAQADDDQDAAPAKTNNSPSFKGAGQNPVRTALPEKTGTLRK
jgi:hypothetical protein